jgi:hypothetical protein
MRAIMEKDRYTVYEHTQVFNRCVHKEIRSVTSLISNICNTRIQVRV